MLSERETNVGHVTPVAVSADGSLLASVEGGVTVRLFSLKQGALTKGRLLEGGTGAIISLAISPTEKVLAAGGYGGTTVLWDFSGEPKPKRKSLIGVDGIVEAVTFSSNGRLVATSNSRDGVWSEPGEVQIWDSSTGKLMTSFVAHQRGMVRAMDFAPQGDLLATGSYDRSIKLWDVSEETPQLVGTLDGHTDAIWCLKFSPDGRTIVSGGSDHAVRVWDVGARKQRHCLDGHSGAVYDVTFAPNGREFFSGANDGTVCHWRLSDPEMPGVK